MKTTASDLESKLKSLGLTFERMPLKTRPNAVHWHIRTPGEKGTLEATLDRDELVFEVRANRQGPWIEQVLVQLQTDKNQEPT